MDPQRTLRGFTRDSERRVRRRSIRTSLPLTLWLGLAAFALGAAGDIAHHTIESLLPSGLERLLGPEAVNAHMVTLFGMVAIMVGVIRFGTRPRPRPRLHPVPSADHRGRGKEQATSSSKEM